MNITCEFHGYDKLTCPACRAEQIASDAEGIRNGTIKAGVFAWTGQNDYQKENALRLYKSKSAANRYAEKLNSDPLRICANGYIVRLVR